MKLRRLNNAIHRDLGYFVVGATLLYAVSGLALNHADDWDPNFVVERREVQTTPVAGPEAVSKQWVLDYLEPLGEREHYRSHDFPTSSKMKIYLDEGSVFLNLKTGRGVLETVRCRPGLYQMNCLHLNPSRMWLVFSDFFAISLVVLAITGLFVVRGVNGIARRGALLAAAGAIVPLAFMILAS